MNQVHAQIEAPAQAPAQASKQAPAKLAYHIAQGFRPMSGAKLFAHTAAFLDLSGISEKKPVARALAVRVMGQTAVKYHTERGNFHHAAEGLFLTVIGTEYLRKMRAVDPELRAAFVEVLSTGKPNDKVCKNPIGIKAI
jgi:hypothetical protein